MFAECVHNFAAGHGLTASLFLGGMVGSLTHCAGMCSPFVLAQTENGPVLQKSAQALLLPYHLGRMTTYIFLGVLVHSVINLAYLFSETKVFVTAPLLMLAGVLFLANAFPALSALFPWAARLSLPLPVAMIGQATQKLFRKNSPLSRYFLGILLGFMPCGLVVAALMAAATAPGPFEAALAMAAFSVGTMPVLILIGLGGRGFKQKFPRLSARFSQTALVISSLWLFALAGMLIF